jgi:hypothetical protein
MLQATVTIEPQKIREVRPTYCDRGAQINGPTTDPAMEAETYKDFSRLQEKRPVVGLGSLAY